MKTVEELLVNAQYILPCNWTVRSLTASEIDVTTRNLLNFLGLFWTMVRMEVH